MLCDLRKEIKRKLKESGLNVKSGLENFFPLWKHVEKGQSLQIPPIVVLDHQNNITGYHCGGRL